MYTYSTRQAEIRMQSNLKMLRTSLQKVFPARDDKQFNDLLCKLDGAHR